MASGGALVLLLDEVATMVKVTAQKTTVLSGVPQVSPQGDETPSGQRRDLSVIFEVARGSLRNKAILVPAALAVNFFAPFAVLPLLAAGGIYFSYEGIKKVKALRAGGEEGDGKAAPGIKIEIQGETALEARQRKVKKAIKTDMILSAEIVAVTLAAAAALPFAGQALALGGVALGATAVVYTVIAGIIKMEDLGVWLSARPGQDIGAKAQRATGRALLAGKPHVLNGISRAGTLAIFMVGGGLLFHGIPALGHHIGDALGAVASSPYMHSAMKLGASFVAGLATGLAATPVIAAVKDPVRATAPKVWDFLVDFFWVPPAPKKPAPEKTPAPLPPEQGQPAAQEGLRPAPLPAEQEKPALDALEGPKQCFDRAAERPADQGDLAAGLPDGLESGDLSLRDDMRTKDAPPKSHDKPSA